MILYWHLSSICAVPQGEMGSQWRVKWLKAGKGSSVFLVRVSCPVHKNNRLVNNACLFSVMQWMVHK